MRYSLVMLFLAVMSPSLFAGLCPDPETTSLQWGAPPMPWRENPYSPNQPQGDTSTRFFQANILVAGLGQGVTCTYQTSVGRYSIWWPVRVRVPSPLETQWVRVNGGYACQSSIEDCRFTTIQ